ncbi:IS66 family insertion sequence element accessory protein TnpB [Pseudoalteromonas sp. GB43]
MKMFVEPKCIYLYPDAVDFRKSIDGLVAIVEGELERDAYTGCMPCSYTSLLHRSERE